MTNPKRTTSNRHTAARLLTKTLAALLVMATALMAISCCRDGGSHSVPKPEAWPRLEMPTAEYSDRHIGPATLAVNASATAKLRPGDDGRWWADITYPAIPSATLYLSLTETDSLARAIDNRRERMAMNAGGATTELTQITSAGGWECEMAVTRQSLTTPVQLLATDGHRLLLSGAAYLQLPDGTSPDSIAPIVETLSRDMLEMLKHVKTR